MISSTDDQANGYTPAVSPPPRDPGDETTESAPIPAVLYDRLGFLLGRAHLANRRVAASYLAEIGIDPREAGALGVLVNEGPHSQRHLGNIMGIDRTTMVAITDGLEGKGLVRRERNPQDRRAYALVATPRGERLLARATDAIEQAESEFLAALPAAEQRRLKNLLRRLIAD
jgi:MarR family transcriptional regulator, transcriptional regulator for hemolysin